LIYTLLFLSTSTTLIMSSGALSHFALRVFFALITPLALKENSFKQYSPPNTYTKGSKGYHVKRDEAKNCMLLFVCVVNLQESFVQKTRYKRMIQHGVLSISRFYPGASVLILYGEVGAKPNLTLPANTRVQLEEIATKSFNEEGGYTSFGRMKAYRDIINDEFHKDKPRNIIFYDADMLFVGSQFRKVFGFRENWAIGLSFRNMPKFPVNCGLMLVKHDGLEKGLIFWGKLLSYYDTGIEFHRRAIRKNDIMADPCYL